MEENVRNIQRAIFFQCLGVKPPIEIEVSLEGQKYRIQGREAPLVDGPPVIVLLKKGPTKEEAVLVDGAESSFNAAVRDLLEKGKKFYTALSPTWDSSRFIWTKAIN